MPRDEFDVVDIYSGVGDGELVACLQRVETWWIDPGEAVALLVDADPILSFCRDWTVVDFVIDDVVPRVLATRAGRLECLPRDGRVQPHLRFGVGRTGSSGTVQVPDCNQGRGADAEGEQNLAHK